MTSKRFIQGGSTGCLEKTLALHQDKILIYIEWNLPVKSTILGSCAESPRNNKMKID